MSTLSVDTIQGKTAAGTVSMPAGATLQVVQTALTSAVTVSSPTSFTDISGLSVAITPKFSNSKVLINVFLVGEAHTADFHAVFRLLRGSTAIGIGDANGTAPRASFMIDSYGQGSLSGHSASFHFLDSPSSTSSTTYKIQVQAHSGTGDVYIGRNRYDNNGDNGPGRFPSIITATEIAG
tara:strand:+ start:1443 stop:1982 length:540 start_codon:yes stop_codon:yes gene_type:complete